MFHVCPEGLRTSQTLFRNSHDCGLKCHLEHVPCVLSLKPLGNMLGSIYRGAKRGTEREVTLLRVTPGEEVVLGFEPLVSPQALALNC